MAAPLASRPTREVSPSGGHAGVGTAPRRPSGVDAAFLGPGIVLVLGLVIPALFAELRPSHLQDPAVAIAYLLTVYSSLRIAQIVFRGREALVQLVFWCFVYLWFGLAATAQLVADVLPLPFQTFTSAQEIKTTVVILIGVVGFDLGTVVARRRAASPVVPVVDRFQIQPRRIWLLGGLGAVIATVVVAVTGIAARFASRDVATAAFFAPTAGQRVDQVGDKAATLILLALLWVPPFLAMYLMVYLHRSGREAALPRVRRWLRSPLTRGLLVVLVVVNLLVNNPISNSRYQFGGVALSLLIAGISLRRPTRFRVAAVGFLVVLVLVYPYADVFRYDERLVERESVAELLTTSPDYGMFQIELNTTLYIEENGHTNGRQLSGVVGSVVPRRIWADKPIATGDVVSRSYDRINASATLWAEWNIDFGPFGVAAMFFLYGWLARGFDDAYIRRRSGPTVIGAAVPLFAAFQIFLLRGSLQPAFGELAPIAVLFLFCLGRRREAAPRPRQG